MDKATTALTLIGALLVGILIIIFAPALNFVFGWVLGWFITKTFASTFIDGVALLGIHLTVAKIPLFCGILSCIAGFFKPSYPRLIQTLKKTKIESLLF